MPKTRHNPKYVHEPSPTAVSKLITYDDTNSSKAEALRYNPVRSERGNISWRTIANQTASPRPTPILGILDFYATGLENRREQRRKERRLLKQGAAFAPEANPTASTSNANGASLEPQENHDTATSATQTFLGLLDQISTPEQVLAFCHLLLEELDENKEISSPN